MNSASLLIFRASMPPPVFFKADSDCFQQPYIAKALLSLR